METALLIIGIILFAAWVTGLIVAIPKVGRKLMNNSGGHSSFRKTIYIKRKKAY